MRTLAAFALLAVSACAQDATRVYHFANLKTPRDFQEVSNLFRTVGGIDAVTVQNQQATLTITGTSNQVALADWLFPQLDQSPAKPGPSNGTYTMTGDLGTVRVFHFAHANTSPQVQEIVNVVRTAADIQRIGPVNSAGLLAVRGTADQVGATDWLISQLDVAGPEPGTPVQAHQLAGVRDPEMRVAHLAHTTSPQALQELVNTMRTVVDVNRVMPVHTVATVVFRGTAEQIPLAEWVISQIDQAIGQQGPAPHQQQFMMPWDPSHETQVRVFYFSHANTPAAIQEIVNAVRVNAQINRVFPCNQPKAIVVRGSADQVSKAADLVAQLDK